MSPLFWTLAGAAGVAALITIVMALYFLRKPPIG